MIAGAHQEPFNKPTSRERVMRVKDPSLEKGELKAFAGSRSDDFNHVLLSDVRNTLWTKHSSDEWRAQQLAAVAGGLRGIEPRDELEGMLAAQAIAAHHAAMECYLNPCRAPAMPNGKCRMHGGPSPGAPKGEANGNYRHGSLDQRGDRTPPGAE